MRHSNDYYSRSSEEGREMTRRAGRRAQSTRVWLAIGAGLLIILIIVWLLIASYWGDTDVAAGLLAVPSALA